MTGDLRNDVVGPAAEDARDRDGHRLIWLGVSGAIICFLVLGALFVWRTAELQSQADVLSSSVTQQHDAAQALSDQVRELGGVPTVQPPAVTGVAGPQGATGPQGPPGPTGPSGPTGPTGVTGAAGSSGAAGAAGNPGAAGTNGTAGSQGPAGAPGADGRPPAGWTWTAPDGTAYNCTRDASSPDTAPTYSCSAAPTTTSPAGLLRIGR